jgi:hypothetical protein
VFEGEFMSGDDLVLPSAGPDPIPFDIAVSAVLGYALGRRPLRFRSPSYPHGKWVHIRAFGYERFDCHPGTDFPLGEVDILIAEGLHGRLDPENWTALRDTLHDVRPLADAVVERAAGRVFWELPDDEFSVLAEPGTVGALLREVRTRPHAAYVSAALHHRHPNLVPLASTTRWQLFPHQREGDSGVEAVIHRELTANADAFDALERAVNTALDGAPLTRLRLHDILVWLSGSLRLTHAVQLGQTAEQPVTQS